MTYKLIALDMDGTLLGRNKEISEENKSMIKAALAADRHVILATGRPIRDVLPHMRTLQLEAPIVINNGSEVWRSPEQLYKRRSLKTTIVEQIINKIDGYGEAVSFWAHTVQGLVQHTDVIESVQEMEWLQLGVKTKNSAYINEIYEEFKSNPDLEISNSHITNLEFNAKNVNKATGLEKVGDLLGVTSAEMIAVGDSLNDMAMIQTAGLGVAMGNAQETVKQAADVVAPSNAEDGVAWVIDKYLLS